MNETARLLHNGFGFGGMHSLELDTAAWGRLGKPYPRLRPIGGRERSGAPRVAGQSLMLKLRVGEHEAEWKVTKIIDHSFVVFLVVRAIELPEFSEIEIVAATLIDPDPIPTASEQLLRGLLHE